MSDPDFTKLQIFFPNGGTSASQMYIWDAIGQKPIVWDGSVSVSVTSSGSAIQDGVTTTIKATVFNILGGSAQTTSNPLAVAIVDASGAQVTSFGGGTQYTNGQTNITNASGNVGFWLEGTTARAVTTGKPLPVNVVTPSTLSVTVTNTGFLVNNTTGSPVPTSVQNAITATVSNTTGAPVPTSVQNTVTVTGTVTATVNNTAGNPVLATVGNTTGAPVPVTVQNTITANAAITNTSGNPVLTSVGNTVTVAIATTQAALQNYILPDDLSHISFGAVTTTVQAIKASAGSLNGWFIWNPNTTAAAYVQLFDATTGAVTLGSTTPKDSFGIPPNSAANILSARGIAFTTAISVGVTTTRAGSTAPGTGLDLNFFYK